MSLPNDIPDSIVELVSTLSQKPYLKNYEALKSNFGPACTITKKAAEIFIAEHKAELEAIGRALNGLGIGS